jgi:hypothetical protein
MTTGWIPTSTRATVAVTTTTTTTTTSIEDGTEQEYTYINFKVVFIIISLTCLRTYDRRAFRRRGAGWPPFDWQWQCTSMLTTVRPKCTPRWCGVTTHFPVHLRRVDAFCFKMVQSSVRQRHCCPQRAKISLLYPRIWCR